MIRKDNGQVIKVNENLQIIWYDNQKIKEEDLRDLKDRAIVLNL